MLDARFPTAVHMHGRRAAAAAPLEGPVQPVCRVLAPGASASGLLMDDQGFVVTALCDAFLVRPVEFFVVLSDAEPLVPAHLVHTAEFEAGRGLALFKMDRRRVPAVAQSPSLGDAELEPRQPLYVVEYRSAVQCAPAAVCDAAARLVDLPISGEPGMFVGAAAVDVDGALVGLVVDVDMHGRGRLAGVVELLEFVQEGRFASMDRLTNLPPARM